MSNRSYAEEALANGLSCGVTRGAARLFAKIVELEREHTVLGEKVLEEQRMRCKVEREDAVALANMKTQRDALADALRPPMPLSAIPAN